MQPALPEERAPRVPRFRHAWIQHSKLGRCRCDRTGLAGYLRDESRDAKAGRCAQDALECGGNGTSGVLLGGITCMLR
jgi:hypothetical protein